MKQLTLLLFSFLLSYGLAFAQVVSLDKNELDKRGDKYERIEAFYESGRLVKELRYPKQEVDTLANFGNPIGRWSRQTFTYSLTEGDTIDIEVIERKGKKLRIVSFIEGEKSVRATANKAKAFKARLPIVTTGPHSLTINNRKRIGKRFCNIKLIRYAKVVPEVYIPPAPEPEPIPTGPSTRIVIDSVYNLLIDTTFRVASVLDLEHPSTVQILLEANQTIGADTTLQNWEHWIGVGNQVIAEYEKLIQIIPPSLGMPPGGLPLTAHMKKEKVDFPKPNIQEVNSNRKSIQIDNNLLQEQFYFTNKNTVNFYPVRLIAVGLYTSKRTEPIPKEKTTKVE